MKQILRMVSALVVSAVLFTTTSGSKDKDEEVISLEQQLLTAKTWQVKK